MCQQGKDEKAIFLAALEKRTPPERSAFLEAACAGDPALLERVKELLATHEESRGPLDSPPRGIDAYPTTDQPITEGPGTVIGPYKLLQRIGEGGFGVVYMADQTEPVKRRVALKIIKPGMDTRQVIARFEAERQALAMMDHLNIAKVLDAGTTDSSRPYFVMDLVKGVPITQYCDEHHLAPRERLELFVPVCQAIQHAHQKGVIHRDIKPTNILVAEYDDRAVPKIIDFGVAKATEQRLTEKTMFTQFGQVVGTVDYMSPEQAKLNQFDIDTRSDIYSLGVVLYELLTGETPFDRQRLRSAAFDELLRILREEEPPRPSLRLSASHSLPSIAANRHTEPNKLSKLVRGELDWIVMKAMEKDRARRYETANGLASDIKRYLNDEPVVASPPSVGYRFRKFARRNRRLVTTAAVIGSILLLATLVSTWQAVRATRARHEAGLAQHAAEQERSTARQRADEAMAARAEAERAAAEAKTARELAEKREKETQQVSDFQASMLVGIDVKAMGRGIRERFREQVRAALERQYVGEFPDRRKRTPEEVEAELAAFDQRAEAAQTVDVARRVMHEFVLSRAAAALKTKFADQPLVRARLHSAIGITYYNLGILDEAEPQQRGALEIWQHELGEENWQVAQGLHDLGLVLLRKGDDAHAEPLLRESLALSLRTHGHETDYVAHLLGLLGRCRSGKGDVVEAERLHREAVAISRKLHDDGHPYVAEAINGLAQVLKERGDYAAAEALYNEALAAVRKAYGYDHRSVAAVLENLGTLSVKRGDYARAEQLLRESLALNRKLHGDEHPDVARLLGNLGQMLGYKGDYAAAEPLLREALALNRKLLGDEHPDVAQSLDKLAQVLSLKFQYSAAEAVYREALSIAREQPDAEQRAEILCHLVLCLRDAGRGAEALPLARDSVAIYQQLPRDDHGEYACAMEGLAKILRDLGQYEEAVSLLHQALNIRRKHYPHRDPITAWALCSIAEDLRAMGDLEESEKAARQAIDIFRTYSQPTSIQRGWHARAVELVRQALIDAGNPDQAILVQREFVEDCRRLRPADDQTLAAALAMLGRMLIEQDQYAQAEPPLRECLAVGEKALSPDSPSYWLLPDARSLLGGALTGRGATLIESDVPAAESLFAEAEPLLIESADWLTRNADPIPQPYRDSEPRRAMERLVELYEVWSTVAPDTGKAEQAAKWRTKSEKRDPALPQLFGARKLVALGRKSSWAPDGMRLVFARTNQGGLQILNLQSGTISDLAAEGKDPAWSPDGRYVAYVSGPHGRKRPDEEVWLVEPDARDVPPRRVAAGGFPCWSGDEGTLFVRSRVDAKLLAIRVDDPAGKPAVDFEPVIGFLPAVSPDGRRIAFAHQGLLQVLDRDSGATLGTWPLPHPGGNGVASWSPDGQQLAVGGFTPEVGLWVLDLERGGALRVADGAYGRPAWSKDGAKLSFDFLGRGDEKAEIWMIETQGLRTDGRAVAADTQSQGATESGLSQFHRKSKLAFDGFDGKLSLPWEIRNHDPSHVSLEKKPGMLTVTTQHGEFERNRDDYKNLFFIECPAKEGEDFEVTTCLAGFKPAGPLQQVKLVCFDDEDNWVRCGYYMSAVAGQAVFHQQAETGGVVRATMVNAEKAYERLWLRVTKRGNVYLTAYSADGEAYRAVTAMAWGDGSPEHIGLIALSGFGSRLPHPAPEVDASFDFFEVWSGTWRPQAEQAAKWRTELEKLPGP
ncbi:MAG: tetratricopeptide repeat protein [Phycisphaerae bacterium]|nr:tetratricopeptide repeat protein [Phycisphaerae bacterium]